MFIPSNGILRRYARNSPALYFTLVRWRKRPSDDVRRRISETTDLLIDGYPRCGNTFATHAFLEAQESPLNVAHHFHAPAAVKRAARLSVPILAVMRCPQAAVASRLVHTANYDPADAIRDYISFYRCLGQYREEAVIADFDTIIQDFGCVVDALNNRFDKRFGRFEHTAARGAKVLAKVENIQREIDFRRGQVWRNKMSYTYEMRVPAPNSARREAAKKVASELRIGKLGRLLAVAETVYDHLRVHAV